MESSSYLATQAAEFVDFDDFDVNPEATAHLSEIRRDVEHAAVVVAHETKSRMS